MKMVKLLLGRRCFILRLRKSWTSETFPENQWHHLLPTDAVEARQQQLFLQSPASPAHVPFMGGTAHVEHIWQRRACQHVQLCGAGEQLVQEELLSAASSQQLLMMETIPKVPHRGSACVTCRGVGCRSAGAMRTTSTWSMLR